MNKQNIIKQKEEYIEFLEEVIEETQEDIEELREEIRAMNRVNVEDLDVGTEVVIVRPREDNLRARVIKSTGVQKLSCFGNRALLLTDPTYKDVLAYGYAEYIKSGIYHVELVD